MLRQKLQAMDFEQGRSETYVTDMQLELTRAHAALTTATQRTAALERQLDQQRNTLSDALADASAAGAAADASRQQSAELSAARRRAEARAADAQNRVEVLVVAAASQDAELAELRSMLKGVEREAGSLGAEASAEVRRLEAQVSPSPTLPRQCFCFSRYIG